MSRNRGRPRSPAPTAAEQEQLRFLVELTKREKNVVRFSDGRLEDFVLELLEGGCSMPTVAEAAGVGEHTVRQWRDRALQRRRAANT